MNIPECLKKLSPNWAKQFENSELLSDVEKEFEVGNRYFAIGDARLCVVGEANLFSDEYYRNNINKGCEICVDFSYAFAYILDNHRYVRPSITLAELSLEQLSEKFCDHMKDKHGRVLA